MNQKGAHWTQGSYRQRAYPYPSWGESGVESFCSAGAIQQVVAGDPYAHQKVIPHAKRRLIQRAMIELMGGKIDNSTEALHEIVTWNDSPDTTWSKVSARFTRTANRLRKKGNSPS